LYWHLEVIIQELMTQMSYRDCYPAISLTDSLPIILSKRPYQAKVALQVADKGSNPMSGHRQVRCSTKNLYSHGVKFHFLGFDTYKSMPVPEYMYFTAASANDLTSLKTILPTLSRRKVMGDKIFACAPLNTDLSARQIEIMTPIKLKKGQKYLEAADKLFSSYISSVRQPVEAFFNWLMEKTAIQTACKVRSEKGLWVHCFGRLAAAIFILVFYS
jgi:hypothetical protein